MGTDIVTKQGTDLAHASDNTAGHEHQAAHGALSADRGASSDEELFGSFQLTLSSHGVSDPRAISAARAWYAEYSKTVDRQQDARDEKDIRSCLQRLKQMWGADHAANMRLLGELMEEVPEAVALPLYEGRDGDGVRLLNNPALVNFIVTAKRAMDTPPVDWKRSTTDATELEEIKRLMGDPRSDYWRGPRAARLQARYLELLEGKS